VTGSTVQRLSTLRLTTQTTMCPSEAEQLRAAGEGRAQELAQDLVESVLAAEADLVRGGLMQPGELVQAALDALQAELRPAQAERNDSRFPTNNG
jgi:hypothetical protein